MALTSSVGKTVKLANGLKQVTAILVCDNAYPGAGYDVTPALFGLSHFAPTDALTGTLDPNIIYCLSGAGTEALLAAIIAKKLLVYYPTGGGTASPATPAAPKLTSGAGTATAGVATASAVDATTPTLALTSTALTPGQGKALPNNADLTGFAVLAVALGY